MIASLVILPVGFFALRDESIGLPSDESHGMATLSGACASGGPSLIAAFLSREFWLVAATYVFLNGPIALVQTHQVAHLAEVGQPEMLIAGIVGLIGLFSIPGKIGWGVLSDRLWLELVYLAGSSCVAAAILLLLQIDSVSSMWSLYAYSILIGLGYAVAASMNPILSGRFFAGRSFGVILGTLNTFYQGGAAIAIWVAGYAHDVTGSYRIPFLGAIVSVAFAASCAWLAAPRRIGPQRAA